MLPTFLCSLAGGMLVVLSATRVESVAHRFVRLIGVIAFAASVGVGVWSAMRGQIGGAAWSTAGGVLSFAAAAMAAVVMIVAPIMESKQSLMRGAAALGGICGVAAGCAWSIGGLQSGVDALGLNLVGQLLGSFLLGSVTVAWMLGHAYLTATKMTIAPLRRVSRLFSIAVGLRWVYLVACFGIAYFTRSAEPIDSWSGGLSSMLASAWLIVALRIAVGLLAVSLFAYMVADCVRLRSTQSATGILYFASVFVYIGELSSQHLMSQIGVPL